VRSELQIIPVKNMDEVLDLALVGECCPPAVHKPKGGKAAPVAKPVAAVKSAKATKPAAPKTAKKAAWPAAPKGGKAAKR
jgi:hypothetical protein